MPEKEYYKNYVELISNLVGNSLIFTNKFLDGHMSINYDKECVVVSRGNSKIPLKIDVLISLEEKRYQLMIKRKYENPSIPQPGEIIYQIDFPKKKNSDDSFEKFIKEKVKGLESFL